jgi:AcrR family transcriptional regulator
MDAALETQVAHRWAGNPPWVDDDAEGQRLLEVARAEFIARGFRKTTVSTIADRAGVSRRTIHRRLGDKDDIVALVVQRDIRDFFQRVTQSAIEFGTPEEATVEAFVLGIRECRTHPLVAAIAEYEPNTLYGAIFGSSAATGRICEPIALLLTVNSSLNPTAAREIAELLARITATLLLAPSPALPVSSDDEARLFAAKYLVPLVIAGRAGDDLTKPSR